MLGACVVLAALLSGAAATGPGADAPSLEHRTLGRFVRYFEPLSIDAATLHGEHERMRRTAEHTQELRLSFSSHNRSFDMVLKPARDMFAPGLVVEVATPEGGHRLEHDPVHYLEGHLEGETYGSRVSLVVRNGTMTGAIRTTEDLYTIEHARKYFPGETLSFTNVIYRATDLDFSFLNSFEGPAYQRMRAMQRAHEEKQKYKGVQQRQQRRRRADPFDLAQHFTCEVALVADHRYFENDGLQQELVTLDLLIEHLAGVRNIYRIQDFTGVGRGITFAVKQITIYTAANAVVNGQVNPYQFTSETDVNAFLNTVALGDPVLGNWNHVCLAHTLTHRDFDGGILGLAFVGSSSGGNPTSGICADESGGRSHNTGITTTLNFNTVVPRIVSVITVAHEFGHNFGSDHDTLELTPQCAPGGEKGNFIMFNRATDGNLPNNDQFSSCSLGQMGSLILESAPVCFSARGAGAFCGNGIVEDGESCDCGILPSDNPSDVEIEECTRRDPCCNVNCSVVSTAQCSPQAGVCCNEQCEFIGLDMVSEDTFALTNLQPADDKSVFEGGLICSDGAECFNKRACIRDSLFQGRCPPQDWVFRSVAADRVLINPVAGCQGDECLVDVLDPNLDACSSPLTDNCYFFHQPRLTPCNNGANVCQVNGCTGSVCQTFTATNVSGQVPAADFGPPQACQIDDPNDLNGQCQVACEFLPGECSTLLAYSSTLHGANLSLAGIQRGAGRSCANFKGFCDTSGRCIDTESDIQLVDIFNFNAASWIQDNYPLLLGLAGGFILLFILLRVTYRKKKVEIDNAFMTLKHRARSVKHRATTMKTQTLNRLGGKGPRPSKMASIRGRPGATGTADNRRRIKKGEGVQRLKMFFPTVTDMGLLQSVMRTVKNEEEAIKKLLRMGFPLKAV